MRRSWASGCDPRPRGRKFAVSSSEVPHTPQPDPVGSAQWFFGKSQAALGNYDRAYEAFRRAYQVERNVESIPRELAGVCLELRRFDEGVEFAQAAVTLDPGNAEALGNLAVA